MRVHIVWATSGQYDDRREWIVKGFLDQRAAEKFAMACEQDSQRMRGHRNLPHDAGEDCAECRTALDPYWSYDEVDYSVQTDFEIVEEE